MEKIEELLVLVTDAQKSKRNHASHSKKVTELLSVGKKGKNEVMLVFTTGILDQLLLYPKMDASVQRFIDFLALVLISLDSHNLQDVIDHLLLRLKSTVKSVRHKTCEIFENYLDHVLKQQVDIPCQIVQSVTEAFIKRLSDKVATIRAAAVSVLKYLQDSDDNKDPAMIALTKVMAYDSSAVVRKLAVQVMALNEQSKPKVLLRMRDVHVDVRIAVFERLTEETDLRQFSKETRVDILVAGLTDREKTVVAVAEQLLQKWFEHINRDVVKFLNYLGKGNDESVFLIVSVLSERVCGTSVSDEEAWLLNVDFETADSSLLATLLWIYVRCNYLQRFGNKFDLIKYVETYLPDAFDLKNIMTKMVSGDLGKSQAVLKYFALLLPFTAITTDLSGIQSLQEIALMLVESEYSSDDVIALSCKALKSFDSEVTRGPKSINLLTNILKTMMEDEDRLQDVALIFQWFHQNDQYSTIRPLAESMVEKVLKAIQKPDASVRAGGISLLGMLCVVDDEIRPKYVGILRQVAFGTFEDSLVRNVAIQALVDSILVAPDEVLEDHKNQINSFLANAIAIADYDIRGTFLESAAKIIFGGISTDPFLVSKLLGQFFLEAAIPDDLEEADIAVNSRTQQLLSVFFHAYMAKSDHSFETMRESLSLFVSDLSTAVKDMNCTPQQFSEAFEKFVGMCDSVFTQVDRQYKEGDPLKQETMKAFTTLKLTAFSCTCRELLKLDDSKEDKAFGKELIKVLSHINRLPWLDTSQKSAVVATLEAIKDSFCKGAKVLEKQIAVMIYDLNFSSVEFASVNFFDSAPGLREIVQLSSTYVEDASMIDEEDRGRGRRRRAASSRSTAAVTAKHSDGSEDEDDSEEDEGESDNEDDAGTNQDEEAEEADESNEKYFEELPATSNSRRAYRAVMN